MVSAPPYHHALTGQWALRRLAALPALAVSPQRVHATPLLVRTTAWGSLVMMGAAAWTPARGGAGFAACPFLGPWHRLLARRRHVAAVAAMRPQHLHLRGQVVLALPLLQKTPLFCSTGPLAITRSCTSGGRGSSSRPGGRKPEVPGYPSSGA